MSTFNQFGGGRSVASIVNGSSTSGGVIGSMDNLNNFNTRASNSGSMPTANALYTVLSITGRGALNFCAASANDTTSRTIRIKVTIDGRSIFDSTSSAITTVGNGLVAVGALSGNTVSNYTPELQSIRFYTSCLVQIASSVGPETDKIKVNLNYETDL